MSWISTDDELPREDDSVLVWDAVDKAIKIDHTCICRENPDGYVWCGMLVDEYQNIKYWMPLPEEPDE